MKTKWCAFVTALLLLFLALVSDQLVLAEENSIPARQDFTHVDPVDLCLFACSMCYEKSQLLECANKACLGYARRTRRRLSMDYVMKTSNPEQNCPGFDQLRRRK